MANRLEFIGNSGEGYVAEKKLAQGGQGSVYEVRARSDGKSYAVKWYHTTRASDDQRGQLEELVRHGAPLSDMEGVEFIWPIEMVRYGDSTSFGYVMPLYDTSRYVHFNRVINRKVKQPRQDKLCRLSYLVVSALETVHREGLAYCDINLGNIQFDLEGGSIIVCDNDNVIVNNSDTHVAGVAEFMAPEVALGAAKPNAQSDLYSLAVLLYQIWMYEHPMEGKQTAEVRCWDQPAKIKRYAKEPLFVHDPNDRGNSAEGDPMLAYSLKRWEELCPTNLKDLFTRTFTGGVHQPSKRPRLSEWKEKLMELEADATVCVDCAATNLVDRSIRGQSCFHCDSVLPVRLVLNIKHPGGSSGLAVHTGGALRQHHLEVHSRGKYALSIVGIIEDHPRQPGAHILRNHSDEAWLYEVGEERYRIEPGKARALAPGGKVYIGDVTITVENIGGEN